MENATIIGVDLGRNVFKVHTATAGGSVVFRDKLTRTQLSILGVTPKLNEAGGSKRVKCISLCGDAMMRTLLYEAAELGGTNANGAPGFQHRQQVRSFPSEVMYSDFQTPTTACLVSNRLFRPG
ncbi:transposase [Ensifer sp. LCM 4579]|uniref:transposase n=1 Tax=Ensifer sp. LCM 4579 TaxID=1848292 RepID=UPI0026898895